MTKQLTPAEQLKEIAHENLMSGGDKDMGWLIDRVYRLTQALEHLSKCPEPFCVDVRNGGEFIMLGRYCKEALEE